MPSVRSRLVWAKSRAKCRRSSAVRDRGELVDDHLGLGFGDGQRDRLGVEGVADHRPPAEVANQLLLGLAAGHAGDLVSAFDQAGEELPAERARRSCDKIFMVLSFQVSFLRRDGALRCDSLDVTRAPPQAVVVQGAALRAGRRCRRKPCAPALAAPAPMPCDATAPERHPRTLDRDIARRCHWRPLLEMRLTRVLPAAGPPSAVVVALVDAHSEAPFEVRLPLPHVAGLPHGGGTCMVRPCASWRHRRAIS